MSEFRKKESMVAANSESFAMINKKIRQKKIKHTHKQTPNEWNKNKNNNCLMFADIIIYAYLTSKGAHRFASIPAGLEACLRRFNVETAAVCSKGTATRYIAHENGKYNRKKSNTHKQKLQHCAWCEIRRRNVRQNWHNLYFRICNNNNRLLHFKCTGSGRSATNCAAQANETSFVAAESKALQRTHKQHCAAACSEYKLFLIQM